MTGAATLFSPSLDPSSISEVRFLKSRFLKKYLPCIRRLSWRRLLRLRGEEEAGAGRVVRLVVAGGSLRDAALLAQVKTGD